MTKKQLTYVDIYHQFRSYFPGEGYTFDRVCRDCESGEIVTEKQKFFLHLQAALLQEKVLELQVDRNPRVFFTRLHDDSEEDEMGKREKGSLQRGTNLVVLPVEPGLGNYSLRYSRYIILRLFTFSYAVELVTKFTSILFLQNQPMLQLAFPELGRLVHDTREYRASVPHALELSVYSTIERLKESFVGRVVDISLHGLCFSLTREEYKKVKVDDKLHLSVVVEGQKVLSVSSFIRHRTKLRTSRGLSYVCGVRIDVENHVVASGLESLVAQVQRTYLSETSRKIEEYQTLFSR